MTSKNKPDFENLKRKLTSKLVKCQMKSVPDSVQWRLYKINKLEFGLRSLNDLPKAGKKGIISNQVILESYYCKGGETFYFRK